VTDKFVRTWLAFDPSKEQVKRLQINDHATAVVEAKEVFRAATEGIFDE
jgi:hypothetical protein